jgi:hypothetical protein
MSGSWGEIALLRIVKQVFVVLADKEGRGGYRTWARRVAPCVRALLVQVGPFMERGARLPETVNW